MANLNSSTLRAEDLVTSYNSLRNSKHYASKRATKRDAIRELSEEYGLSQAKLNGILYDAEDKGMHVYSRKGFYDSFKNEGMAETVTSYLASGLSLTQVAKGLGVSKKFVGSVLERYDSGDRGVILYHANLKVASGEGTVRDGSRGPFRSLGAAAANDPNVFGNGEGADRREGTNRRVQAVPFESLQYVRATCNVNDDDAIKLIRKYTNPQTGVFDMEGLNAYAGGLGLLKTSEVTPQIVPGTPVKTPEEEAAELFSQDVLSAGDPAAMPVSPLMIPVSQTPAPRDYNSLLEEIAESKDAPLEKRSRAQNLLESIPMGGAYDPTRNAVKGYITGLNDNELCQGVPLTAGAASADSAPAGDEIPIVALIPGESPVDKEEPSMYATMERFYARTLTTIRNNSFFSDKDRLNQVRDLKQTGIAQYCEIHHLDADNPAVDDVRRMLTTEEGILERAIRVDQAKTDSTKYGKGVSPSTDGGSWWDRHWKKFRDVAILGALAAGAFLAVKTANKVDELEKRPTAYVQLTKEDYKVITGLYAGETQKVLDAVNARGDKQDKKIASLETIAAAQSGDLNKSINALPGRVGDAVGAAFEKYAAGQKSEHDAILKNVSNLINAYNQKSNQPVAEVKPVPVRSQTVPEVEALMTNFYGLTKQIGAGAGAIEAAMYERKIRDSKNDADKIEWLKIAIEKLNITLTEKKENDAVRAGVKQ